MAEVKAMISENIETMNRLEGFDVVIVCTGTALQANFWQTRLDGCKGSVVSKSATIVAVDEDWEGGAGNAVGTLYAFSKAARIAKEKYGMDIQAQLNAGAISVGMFHTAGKGTRLAPLPGAENNNKPGVKLAATVKVDGVDTPITILEAVIKQTGCYASSRLGRLSVFWGDQIFIPAVKAAYKAAYHCDILCFLGPMMDAEEWEAKGMHKYGLIAVNAEGKTAQVEKVDHASAVELLSKLGTVTEVGASLGSFSVSWQMLDALLSEFSKELAAKKGKFDSDPHLWMPMTLDRAGYTQLMLKKGTPEAESSAHFDRIAAMMVAFNAKYADVQLGTFGPVSVGQDCPWWDYGLLALYRRNTLLLTEQSEEADLMKKFLGIAKVTGEATVTNSTVNASAAVCSNTVLLNSTVAQGGKITNSILVNVHCNYIEANNCVLVNVSGDRIIASKDTILYNVADSEGNLLGDSAALEEGSVVTGVFDNAGKQTVQRSSVTICGGNAWDEKVCGNDHTFGELYKLNMDADPVLLSTTISAKHSQVWGSFSGSGKH